MGCSPGAAVGTGVGGTSVGIDIVLGPGGMVRVGGGGGRVGVLRSWAMARGDAHTEVSINATANRVPIMSQFFGLQMGIFSLL